MLVDEGHRILHVSETAGRFLLQPGGPLSTLAVDLVRPELKLDLQASLHRAFEQEQPTLTLPVAVQFNGAAKQVSLFVRPIKSEGASPMALVLLLEAGPVRLQTEETLPSSDGNDTQVVAQLRSELSATQAHLRTSREQYETITEELRASNEELRRSTKSTVQLPKNLKPARKNCSRSMKSCRR